MTVVDAGNREKQALLSWWRKNAVGLRSFMIQMEMTIYDLAQDVFVLPEGYSVRVVDCIRLEM